MKQRPGCERRAQDHQQPPGADGAGLSPAVLIIGSQFFTHGALAALLLPTERPIFRSARWRPTASGAVSPAGYAWRAPAYPYRSSAPRGTTGAATFNLGIAAAGQVLPGADQQRAQHHPGALTARGGDL